MILILVGLMWFETEDDILSFVHKSCEAAQTRKPEIV